MSRKLAALSLAALLITSPALADAPRVAVDIAPVHSLVARVMQGVGTPDMILQQGASPHEYSLRPSDAAALQDADLVVWMGERLAPWMEGAVATLAGDAHAIELLHAEGTTLLPFREGALFEKHSHGDAEEAHEEAGHEEHDHKDESHEEHGHKDAGHDGHDHGNFDPHAWLSPDNATAWLGLIAEELAEIDPDNAETYRANAAAAREEIAAVSTEVNGMLDPLRGGRFVVFHDAYQYFETAYGFPASGSILISDATEPSPARLAEIHARVADEGIECVLAEPQFNPGLVAAVMDGTKAKTAVIDPLGANLAPGPDLYPQLLRNLAKSLASCL